MDACRTGMIKNVEILFNNDDLDYLHCNNDGDDALKILKVSENPKSKYEYKAALINAIRKQKNEAETRENEHNRLTKRSYGLGLGRVDRVEMIKAPLRDSKVSGDNASKNTESSELNSKSNNSPSKPTLSSGKKDNIAQDASNSKNSDPASNPSLAFDKKNNVVQDKLNASKSSSQSSGPASNHSHSFGKKNLHVKESADSSESNSQSSGPTSNLSHSFAMKKNVGQNKLNASESNNQSSGPTSNQSHSFAMKKNAAQNKLNASESNNQSSGPSSNHSHSFDQKKLINKENVDQSLPNDNLKVDDDDDEKRPRSFPSQPQDLQLEQEIESVVGEILGEASPEDVKMISESLSTIASRKARNLYHRFISDDFYDNSSIEAPNAPNYYQPMNYQQMMMQQMCQQQMQQLMQMSYAGQIQFNMQMQQIMAMETSINNQSKRKKRKTKHKK